jgi:hypothetical protein
LGEIASLQRMTSDNFVNRIVASNILGTSYQTAVSGAQCRHVDTASSTKNLGNSIQPLCRF